MSIENFEPGVLADLLSGSDAIRLEPLSPSKAVEMYTSLREDELEDSTLRTHRSRLSFFVEWCDENELENLNDLTGRQLLEFRNWRKKQLDSQKSLESNLRTVRTFLRKCVKFDGVHPIVPEKIDIPTLSDKETSRDVMVPPDVAAAVLDHLAKFNYASTEHVVWLLFVEAGLRSSALYSLDVGDFEIGDDGGYFDLTHRPESNTGLKNKHESERLVHLSKSTSRVVQDYLDDVRPDVTDEFGRRPLIASKHGRLRKTTMRKYVYAWTRPCVIFGTCPHDVSPDEFGSCDARESSSTAYKCPSSKSPHAIRRGYLTTELDAGVPKAVLSDRCDVSPEVIDASYDERDEGQKMRLRKELRDLAYRESNSSGYSRGILGE